ncbi:hypothetical protein E5288_WYG001816 [Bos mutus]|uniref:Uncharacterized protein n=1 Tax=Bos mutus TaxID=72004 RepID=A0A6B0S006_9CETA|nr:hypothetical protein [Bos mutus]
MNCHKKHEKTLRPSLNADYRKRYSGVQFHGDRDQHTAFGEPRSLRSAQRAEGLPAPHQSAGDGHPDGRTFPELLAFSFNSLEVFAIPARLPACNGPIANRARVRGATSPLLRKWQRWVSIADS